MGYVQDKYTEEYFLHKKQNEDGTFSPTNYGALGIEEFNKGGISQRHLALLKQANFVNASVLEIGFGRGEAIKYACDKGAKKVMGVDFSSAAVKIATKYLNKYADTSACRVNLFCGDILDFLPGLPAKSFDLVLMIDVIEHIPKQEAEQVLRHVNRVLCHTGKLLVETPFYSVDEDIIAQQGVYTCPSITDTIPETKGMHCNKFTEKRFIDTLVEYGFEKRQGCANIFVKATNI